jgi:hypothetical protein
VQQVQARARAGEDVSDEDALVDLQAQLVSLQPLPLGLDRRSGGDQGRVACGSP